MCGPNPAFKNAGYFRAPLRGLGAPTALEIIFISFLQIDRAYGAGMAISQVFICECLMPYVSAIRVSPRIIQLAMGHSSLETSMGFLHAESLSVRSPLESILGGNFQSTENPVSAQAAALAPLFPKSALTHPA